MTFSCQEKRIERLKMNLSLQQFKLKDDLPKNGKLFFLAGQGLGDTIYGNRLIFLLRNYLPDWQIVVFLSKDWKDISFTEETNFEIVWYPSIDEYPDRYKWGEIYIKKNLDRKLKNYFIKWDSIDLPDRYSLHETVFESTCRGINIQITPENRQGYVHLSRNIYVQAKEFLDNNDLTPGQFYVFGPHTMFHKNWGVKNFEDLGHKIYSELGLKGIIVGVKGDPLPIIPSCFSALSMPLDFIAALISQSAFFVGNDSGITHMAGCFNIPVYEIFAKARLEPLIEWRTLGPAVRYPIEPALDKSNSITVSSIYHLIEKDLEYFKKNNAIKYYRCPACLNKLEYFLDADEKSMSYLCSCGGSLTINDSGKKISDFRHEEFFAFGTLPEDASDIERLSRIFQDEKNESIKVSLEISNPFLPNKNTLRKPSFHWSLDSVFRYFLRYNFHPTKIISSKIGKDKILASIYFGKGKKGEYLWIPWGGGIGFCGSYELYMKYFFWNTFSVFFRANKIPKNIMDYNKNKLEALLSALFILTAFRTKKSLIVFLKTMFRLS